MSHDTPFFSIVIPLYNRIQYSDDLIDSIAHQTFQDFEVVITDDCSTDGVYEYIENKLNSSYILRDKYKLNRTKQNSGSAGPARTAAMSLATGEYLVFIDSDDAIKKEALQEIYNRISEFPEADVIHFQKYYLSKDDRYFLDKKNWKTIYSNRSGYSFTYPQYWITDKISRVRLYGVFWHAPWSLAVKRELVVNNNLKFGTTGIGEDDYFFLGVLMTAEKFLIDPITVFYLYRDIDDSQSRNYSRISNIDYFKRWYVNSFMDIVGQYRDAFKLYNVDLTETELYQFINWFALVYTKRPFRQKFNEDILEVVNPIIKDKFNSMSKQDIADLALWLIDEQLLTN